MKVGLRAPSPEKIVKAKTTGRIKRAVKGSYNPVYGEKGIGYLKDPERAIKNKVYHKVTFDPLSSVKGTLGQSKESVASPSKGLIVPIILFYLSAMTCEAYSVFIFFYRRNISIVGICTSIICYLLFVLLYIRKYE